MTNTYKRTNLKNDDPLVINNITTPNNVIPSKDYGMNVIETVDLSDIVKQSNHTDLLNGKYALPQAPVYYSSTGYSAAVTDFENKYQISIDKLEAAKAEYEDKVYVLENLSLQMPDDSFARYQVSYKEDIDYWIQYIKDMGENNEAKLAMQKFGWTTEDLATKSNEELLKIASLNDQDYQDTMETYKEYFAPLKDLGLIEGDYAAFGEIDQLLAENKYYLSLVEAELKTQRYKQSTVKYDLILETESYQNLKDSLPEEPINAPTADTKDTLLFMNNFNPKFTQIYNYLYQTQGYEAAYAYISDITDEMNQFRGMKQANERIDKLILANEEDIKAIETQFASLDTSNATNVKKFLNFVSSKVDDTSVQTLINEFDYNDKDSINQNLQKIVEEVNGVSRLKTMSLTNFGLTAGTGFMDGLYDFGEGYAKIFSKGEITVQDYEEMYYANYLAEHSKYYDDIYGVGQGVGNMLPTTVTGAILYATAPEIAPFVTGSMIAGSSFGTTKNQMLYEGYDAKTAMLYAGLTAGSDALLEVVFGGVEGVGVTAKSAFGSAEKVTFRNLALHQLREMVQEGGEEVLQDLVKSGAIDTIVLGKTFDLGEFTEQSAKTFFQSAMVAGVLNTSTAPINIAVNGVKHSLNQQEIMRLHEMINNGQGYQSSLQTIISEQNNSRLADDEFYQFSLQHPGMTTEALNTLYQQYKNKSNTETNNTLSDENMNIFRDHDDISSYDSMKRVYDVLNQMANSSDPEVRQIAENIQNIYQGNLSSLYFSHANQYQKSAFGHYDSVNYGTGSSFILNNDISNEVTAHEFGHMLFDVVDYELPSNYDEVMQNTINNLNNNQEMVKEFLNEAIEYKKQFNQAEMAKVNEYFDAHLEYLSEMADEIINDRPKIKALANEIHLSDEQTSAILNQFDNKETDKLKANLQIILRFRETNRMVYEAGLYDHQMQQIDMITGVIDSVYNGQNPYYDLYINSGWNGLRYHNAEYFSRDDMIGFNEQMADYNAMRVYKDEYATAWAFLENALGDEWFNMMSDKYAQISNKVATGDINMSNTSHVNTEAAVSSNSETDANVYTNLNSIEQIISSNNELTNKQMIFPLLRWIDNLIPNNYKNNFYTNLKSLKIEYNLDGIDNTEFKDSDVSEHKQAGGYDPVNNEIVMDKKSLRIVKEISASVANPREFFNTEYMHTLLHELCHMASSRYDASTGTVYVGFDKYPYGRYRGLTEGMTELLAHTGYPSLTPLVSNYYMELCFADQLVQIVGKDTMLEAYFEADGIEKVKQKLLDIGVEPERVMGMLSNIESNYMARYNTNNQSFAGNAQSILLDCFDAKCADMLKNGELTSDNVNALFEMYKGDLVTNERILAQGKDPSTFRGINESLTKFESIKQKYIEKLGLSFDGNNHMSN